MRELGTALAQTQESEQAHAVWAEAERVIASIDNGYHRASVLSGLGAGLMNANKHLQFLRLVQYSWQQADTRDFAVALLSLANGLLSLKPEIGIDLFESFSWVDDFLKG